jgi:hypothetical protein
MQIEAGKFYRTRDGRKVGPAKFLDEKFYADQGYPWSLNGLFMYQSSGIAGDGAHEEHDLVAEWFDTPTGPVRTVTRKEIRGGTYGRLRIEPGLTGTVLLGVEDGIDTDQTHWTEKELRAAAATLIELADALREAGEQQMESAV